MCTYYNFIIHSSVNGHLGCFHVAAIVNSAAVNNEIHVSFSILISSGYMPRSGIAGSHWKTQQWSQDWKRSVFIPIPKKDNAKKCSDYHTIALFSHSSKVMLKILQARLQQYRNREFPDFQACFRKGKGTRDQIANILWITKKAREFQKNIYLCFIDYAKVWRSCKALSKY